MKTLPLIFLAGILVAAGLAGCGKKEVPDRLVHSALGQFIASKITAAAPNGGTVVVLIQKGGSAAKQSITFAQLTGLRDGLGGAYTIKEVGPDLSTIKPGQEGMVVEAMSNGWPLRAVYRWCQSDSKAVAVVSLLVTPMPNGLNQKLLAKLPPVFVLEPSARQDLIALAQTGALSGLVVPLETPGKVDPSGTPEEIVASRYEYVSR